MSVKERTDHTPSAGLGVVHRLVRIMDLLDVQWKSRLDIVSAHSSGE
jgi:hypothetical protein